MNPVHSAERTILRYRHTTVHTAVVVVVVMNRTATPLEASPNAHTSPRPVRLPSLCNGYMQL